jgi:YfiH family protein
MIKKEKSGLQWLEFESLQKYPVKHGVLLRHGGVSVEPYQSLNLSQTVLDDPKAVVENRERVKRAFNLADLFFLEQCHGECVHAISSYQSPLKGDGVMTQTKNLALFITHADCQAALFYDPVHNALAAVHSGWRGSVLNIYKKTIASLKLHYNTDPKNLIVCISPSLGPESAEFVNYEKELPTSFWPFQAKKNYFDFWAISQLQLKECGVAEKNIEIASLDTFRSDDFFSYRRQNKTGRNGTFGSLI